MQQSRLNSHALASGRQRECDMFIVLASFYHLLSFFFTTLSGDFSELTGHAAGNMLYAMKSMDYFLFYLCKSMFELPFYVLYIFTTLQFRAVARISFVLTEPFARMFCLFSVLRTCSVELGSQCTYNAIKLLKLSSSFFCLFVPSKTKVKPATCWQCFCAEHCKRTLLESRIPSSMPCSLCGFVPSL